MQQTQEFRAEARYQRVLPQKARLVLDLIKGRRVEEALQTVMFTKKGVAPLVEKVLRSAVQNANHLSDEQGLDVDVDSLYVKSAVANDGPRMKRIRPAPMGRAYRYVRRIAHIDIVLEEPNAGREGVANKLDDAKPAKAKAKTPARAKAKGKAPAGKSGKSNRKKMVGA